MLGPDSDSPALWMTALWWTGGLIFYGRFYVQWIVSELKRRSVVPIAFWYMSAVGSVVLLAYNVSTRQPGAAFGQSFNMVVYARNLIHIWREKGRLTKSLSIAVHGFTGTVVLVGAGLTAYTWRQEYLANLDVSVEVARQNWFFLGIWAMGQGLFFLRFLIQWLVTEARGKSVIPPIFWHLSIAAALLQGTSFAQRQDWVNTVGMAATLVIYVRNVWLLLQARATVEGRP